MSLVETDKVKEKLEIIMRQTDYNEEVALEKLKLHNYDEIKHFEINNKIQQLRWCKRQLVNDIYIGFDDIQLELLYQALVDSLGENNVEKHDRIKGLGLSK